jgi:hypothetical protein
MSTLTPASDLDPFLFFTVDGNPYTILVVRHVKKDIVDDVHLGAVYDKSTGVLITSGYDLGSVESLMNEARKQSVGKPYPPYNYATASQPPLPCPVEECRQAIMELMTRHCRALASSDFNLRSDGSLYFEITTIKPEAK